MRARQWLLLCALVLSVVGMHHVAFTSHCSSHGATTGDSHAAAMPTALADTPVASPSKDPAPGGEHDLLHLCLAVLIAAGGLLLLAWLLTAVDRPGHLRPAWLVTHPLPPPRPAGRSLLTSLCVMRT
jgi:hypothetical protein